MTEKHLKMFSILTHEGNANQNNSDILPHTSQNGQDKKLRRQQVLARMWRKRNSPTLLVELQARTTTLEISMAVPQKTGNDTTGGPCYTTPAHIHRGFPSM